jgi:hypothetical protein
MRVIAWKRTPACKGTRTRTNSRSSAVLFAVAATNNQSASSSQGPQSLHLVRKCPPVMRHASAMIAQCHMEACTIIITNSHCFFRSFHQKPSLAMLVAS